MNITITDPTPAETKGLQRATNEQNAANGTTLTPAQYLRARVEGLLSSYAVQDVDAERAELAAAYRNATQEQRRAARTALGL